MNQLTYQMAITRHQELLEQAARGRLAKQTARAIGRSTGTAGSSRRRISAAGAWRPSRSRIYPPPGR